MQINRREAAGISIDGGDHAGSHVADLGLAGTNSGEQVAHEAASEAGEHQLAAHGPLVVITFFGWPVEENLLAVESRLPSGASSLANLDLNLILP